METTDATPQQADRKIIVLPTSKETGTTSTLGYEKWTTKRLSGDVRAWASLPATTRCSATCDCCWITCRKSIHLVSCTNGDDRTSLARPS